MVDMMRLYVQYRVLGDIEAVYVDGYRRVGSAIIALQRKRD